MKKHLLVVYVPKEYVEKVKSALFDVGAGKLDEYEQCCWQTIGIGQFKSSKSSKPFIGKPLNLEKTEEFRLEVILDKNLIEQAREAINNSHPYETPAYHFIEVEL